MLLERGIVVSYGSIRRWAWKFGPKYARRLLRKQPRRSPNWSICSNSILNSVADAVDGTVEIHPLTTDFDVGLVDMPFAGNGAFAPIKARYTVTPADLLEVEFRRTRELLQFLRFRLA